VVVKHSVFSIKVRNELGHLLTISLSLFWRKKAADKRNKSKPWKRRKSSTFVDKLMIYLEH
jgi:hypothetical protein